MKKPSVILGSGAIVLIVSLFIIWMNHPVQVIIQNKTLYNVELATVVVGPHVLTFENVKSGERKKKWLFYNGSAASLKLEAHMSNGSIMQGHYGQITNGPGFDQFIIQLNQDGSQSFQQESPF